MSFDLGDPLGGDGQQAAERLQGRQQDDPHQHGGPLSRLGIHFAANPTKLAHGAG